MIRLCLALLLGLAAPALAHAQADLVIKNARLVTNQGPVQAKGQILIRGGKIAAIGEQASSPGARVIDAKGAYVTPAGFAAFSRVGLAEIEGEDDANDANSAHSHVQAAVDASYAYNPADTAIAVSRMEGVTRAAVAPNSTGNLFSGQGALAVFDGGPNGVFKPRAFMLINLGDGGASRTGGSRAAVWPYLEQAIDDAMTYPRRYQMGHGGGVLSEPDAKAFQYYVQGQAPLMVRADRIADMRQILAFKARRPELKLIILGGAEAWKIGKELADAKIPVILDPTQNLPDSFESLAARLDSAARLHKAGVKVALSQLPGSDEAHQTRLIFQLAGNAAANGVPWDEAFKMITKNPADILGVGDRFGAIAPGFAADIVIWDGDPLEVTSAPSAVFIGGVEQKLVSRQTLLRDRYKPGRKGAPQYRQ